MVEFTEYYGRFQGLRGNLTGLPVWARFIVGVFALPGMILLVLSILVFVVSLLTLLILTAPVYSVLRSLTGGAGASDQDLDAAPAGAKRVDARIID